MLVIVAATWLGYRNGFINSFLALLQWGAALLSAIFLYKAAAGLMNRYFLIEELFSSQFFY